MMEDVHGRTAMKTCLLTRLQCFGPTMRKSQILITLAYKSLQKFLTVY